MSVEEENKGKEGRSRFSLKEVKHPFLEGLDAGHLGILERCAMPVTFEAGEYVFRQGDPANRFYSVTSGRVDLLAKTASPGEVVVVQTIGAGDLLGWSWICPPYEWNFDARAMERTEAVFFYATRLREECESNPAFGYEVMKRIVMVMMNRLQSTRRALLRRG